MKKNFLFSVLCLLLTAFFFNVNAQIGGFGMVATPTHCSNNYDVRVLIEEVRWDADYRDWEELTGGNIATLAQTLGIPMSHDVRFHAVIIDIPYAFHGNAASIEFDIVINQYGGADRPVILLYSQSSTIIYGGIEYVTNANGEITGFYISPAVDSGGGGGVATTVLVAGYSPDETPCMQIAATNVVGTSMLNQICNIPNFNSNSACGDNPSGRMVQDSNNTPIVSIYPNPVQENLFVETNGLNIEHVNILSLGGQSINNFVSIRRGIDRIQINTSQLLPGIYLMRLETATDAIIKKIIVK